MNGGGEQQPSRGPGSEQQPDDVLQRVDHVLSRAMPGLPPENEQPGSRPQEQEGQETEDERPAPRIYVASLSDYNAGRLHGRWIDADQPLDDISSDIGDMLAESPEPGAEEWAIHDYEGFGSLQLSEYESLGFIADVATGIAEHGEAFAAFAEVAERDQDRLWLFEEMYRGKWDSLEAYAEHLLEDLGVEAQLEQLPEWVRPYVSVDVQALVNELETSGSVTTTPASEGGVHVFDFE